MDEILTGRKCDNAQIEYEDSASQKSCSPKSDFLSSSPTATVKQCIPEKPVPRKLDVAAKPEVSKRPHVPRRPKIIGRKPCIPQSCKATSSKLSVEICDIQSSIERNEKEFENSRSQVPDESQQNYVTCTVGSDETCTSDTSTSFVESFDNDVVPKGSPVVRDNNYEKDTNYIPADSRYFSSAFENTCGLPVLSEEDPSGRNSEEGLIQVPLSSESCGFMSELLNSSSKVHLVDNEPEFKEEHITIQKSNELNRITDVPEECRKRRKVPKPKPRRPPPPPPCLPTKPHLLADIEGDDDRSKKMLNDRQARSSNGVLLDATNEGLGKNVRGNIVGHESEIRAFSEEQGQNKVDRIESRPLEQDAINAVANKAGEKIVRKSDIYAVVKGEINTNTSYEEKTDGSYNIPFITGKTKAENKHSKGNRRSCPPPELPFDKKKELKDRIENKHKSKSFTAPTEVSRNFESKSELQKHFEKLRKRTEEKPNIIKQTTIREELPTVKNEIDEEMEDAVFFDYVLVVKLREGNNGLEPYISFRFPPKQIHDKELDPRLASIPQFCFPDLKSGMHTEDYLEHHSGFSSSETFSFVLTDMVGKRLFGYCRQIQVKGSSKRRKDKALPEVYCIVSPYGFFGLYSQILDEVERQCSFSSSSAYAFLKAVLSYSLPKAGGSIKISFYSGSSGALSSYILKREFDSVLHEHVDLNCLFAKLSDVTITNIVCSLLFERRIILVSSQLSLLSSCCHGFVSLLYPFTWQHTYIPVLPFALVDMCCLPTPYLLGILSGCLEGICDLPIDEAIIVDLDNGKILRQDKEQKIKSFPAQIENQLESNLEIVLKQCPSDPGAKKERNMMLSQLFIDAYLSLVGNFRDYCSDSGADHFQGIDFYKASKSKDTKAFLKEFIKTQAFQHFIRHYENDSDSNKGLFHKKLQEWQISRKSRGTESAWNRLKGKLKVGHR